LPPFGPLAPRFVPAFARAVAAFAAFARLSPAPLLLVAPSAPLRGVAPVLALAPRLGPRFAVRAVRLASGALAALSPAPRARLAPA
ncbi:nicotinate phosphoribosyltransferase, partial [Mycobacterium tuberculosis]